MEEMGKWMGKDVRKTCRRKNFAKGIGFDWPGEERFDGNAATRVGYWLH